MRISTLPLLKQIEKRVFNYSNHIKLVSDGFKPYFKKFECTSYSYFLNGIDSEFLDLPDSTPNETSEKTIMYSGNIGERRGLHRIILQTAKLLGITHKFVVVGEGGIKQKLLMN